MSIVAAAPTDYTAPGVEEFWQPLFGTDGPWAVTRPILLMVVATGLVVWWLLATTKKKALVPGRGQMGTEAVYGLVRNSAREYSACMVNVGLKVCTQLTPYCCEG